ncbi:MAG: DUF4349 domain-containing protein [Solirubrobacterales bacterium]|nr:DUF4349 domain-containing protein [Solirubrobacterales bacterium]
MSRETETEFEELARALRESRPVPEPEFTERLDRVVADHFPPEWTDEVSVGRRAARGLGSVSERFRRWFAGNRTLVPTLAGAVGVLFVIAVVATNVSTNQSGDSSGDDSSSQQVTMTESGSAGDDAGATAGGSSAADSTVYGRLNSAMAPTEDSLGDALRSMKPSSTSFRDLSADSGFARMQGNRDVAREAEITLGTDPDGVQDVANEIVSVTDEHNGIVMDSKVIDGREGTAGATFSLMIPSGQIESAVADLSGIADLRSRSQELTDITAPTNRAEDAIADADAKIKSLLGQLEETYDDDERGWIEERIRWARADKQAAETSLNRLERRADYTPVDLRVETGGDTSPDDESSGWGLGDAIDDAGKLLGVAAGVTVLALAVAIPIGIVVLIALALNRAWVRRSRRRVLEDS